jgi:GntR family transcriptional regulator
MATSSEFSAGAKFLTEREISERFGVSRATANKALSNLVSAGLLEFRKGIGTFTRAQVLDYNLRALVSFTDEVRAARKEPSTRLLSYARLAPSELPGDAEHALEAGDGSVALAMERLRLAGGRPVILERRWVRVGPSPELTLDDMNGSLYEAWSTKYGLAIEGAAQTIRAVSVDACDAGLLEIAEGAAGLLITSTGYLEGHRPLWFERTLYRGDSYEFHNRLGGIQPGCQAGGRFLGGDSA